MCEKLFTLHLFSCVFVSVWVSNENNLGLSRCVFLDLPQTPHAKTTPFLTSYFFWVQRVTVLKARGTESLQSHVFGALGAPNGLD